jgi:HEAT repeat protein
MRIKTFIYFLFICSFAYSQDIKDSRLATIQYGTETEIASLIQTLRNEKTDQLDDELIVLVDGTRNRNILSGVFAFFGEREKNGLEQRAIRAVVERDDEANETVLSAIEYLGKAKCSQAVPVIMQILDTEERRFLNVSFRALGRAGSGDSEAAEEAADFLIDYYTNREPGDDNRATVITALGVTGSSKGVPLLADIASNSDERITLRIAALDALSKIGGAGTSDNSDGLDAILVCISTNDPNVRAAAVAALAPFSGEEVDKAILDAFRDSFYRTRLAAAQASRERKFIDAVPYLKYRAERDDVPNVRDEAIRALGAIANEESMEVLSSLFYERKNTDRIRIAACEMLMKNAADENIGKLVAELDDAKTRNQTNLYNGFLKITGETVLSGDKNIMEDITRRFLRSGTVIEKSYGLDMAVNNSLSSLSTEITAVTKDRNESLARKAQRTAERLGIEISNE